MLRSPIVMTQTVNSTIKDNPFLVNEVTRFIKQFKSGNWGNSKDTELNDSDPKSAMGVYTLSNNDTIWIKSDNYDGYDNIDTVTTVLYPSDY